MSEYIDTTGDGPGPKLYPLSDSDREWAWAHRNDAPEVVASIREQLWNKQLTGSFNGGSVAAPVSGSLLPSPVDAGFTFESFLKTLQKEKADDQNSMVADTVQNFKATPNYLIYIGGAVALGILTYLIAKGKLKHVFK